MINHGSFVLIIKYVTVSCWLLLLLLVPGWFVLIIKDVTASCWQLLVVSGWLVLIFKDVVANKGSTSAHHHKFDRVLSVRTLACRPVTMMLPFATTLYGNGPSFPVAS